MFQYEFDDLPFHLQQVDTLLHGKTTLFEF